MKKALSIFLAVFMTFACMLPAFAAETAATEPAGDEETTETFNIFFRAPSADFADGYVFAKCVDGVIQYEPDPDGDYVFFDGRYMLPSNIVHEEDIPDERFSPIGYDGNVEVAAGETISFRVVTSEKYNVYTAVVYARDVFAQNEKPVAMNAQDEYAVYVDRDLEIFVAEYDEDGKPALLRNHYNVKLTSGDGYKVKTLKGENYQVVYYGDEFSFRVKVDSGYSAAGIKVSVQRGQSGLGGFLDEEDSDMIVGIMGGTETLTSYGVDEDGCRLYTIKNITTDCRVIVSGLQEESNVGIMAFLKRILRLIIDLLGIKLDILDSLTAYYTVNIDATEADGVTYEVIRSSSDEAAPSQFNVTSGDGITLLVTKKDPMQEVKVTWVPGNELATYETQWLVDYDTMTGEVSYVAVYNIDNITSDLQIIIQ